MKAPKMPRLPMEKRKELIGALLDRFVPRVLPRRTKHVGSPQSARPSGTRPTTHPPRPVPVPGGSQLQETT